MVEENLADMDKELAPDNQLRVFVGLGRLPLELPFKNHDVWTFLTPDDLGDRWDIDVGVVPPDEFDSLTFPANLRQPFAMVQVWQRKGTDRQVSLKAVQEVASEIFPSYEPFDLPDPGATSGVEIYETVVEVLTQFARGAHDPADRPVTDICFDRCLWAANRLVLGVANATKDPELHAYAVEELDPFALVASRPWDGSFDMKPILFAVNPDRIRFPRSALTDEEYDRARAYMALEALGQPLLEYARLMRAARRAARIGDHAQAVILASVSGEVLLNLVLRAILVETGREGEIEAMFSDERGLFAARLRRDYGPLLGGQWHPDRPLTPVGRWVAATQSVRNRVVHAGHEPTPFESSEAALGAEGLEGGWRSPPAGTNPLPWQFNTRGNTRGNYNVAIQQRGNSSCRRAETLTPEVG